MLCTISILAGFCLIAQPARALHQLGQARRPQDPKAGTPSVTLSRAKNVRYHTLSYVKNYRMLKTALRGFVTALAPTPSVRRAGRGRASLWIQTLDTKQLTRTTVSEPSVYVLRGSAWWGEVLT